MESLPSEVLGLILHWIVCMSRIDKNAVLPLRTVCKAFDVVLRPYVLKTIQMEYSSFLRNPHRKYDEELASLSRVAPMCDSFYLNMMVIRDEEEIDRLTDMFSGLIPKAAELKPTLTSLRQYCMGEETFDETDFRRVLEDVLQLPTNIRRFKMTLPLQVVRTHNNPSTLLLATTLACLASRGEDHATLETLVLDHVNDTTLNSICNNPMDLANSITVFQGLNNLVLSLKRRDPAAPNFQNNLWFLIRKATNLHSLCLVGWNGKRDGFARMYENRRRVLLHNWRMRSLPYPLDQSAPFQHLRFLEIKRADIDPKEFVQLIKDCAPALKELYLIEVYIKVNSAQDGNNLSLWIGHPHSEKSAEACWVARSLREMPNLKLSVVRATGLGYDDYEPDLLTDDPEYDLEDQTHLERSFDRRFVEEVMLPDEELSILKALEKRMRTPHSDSVYDNPDALNNTPAETTPEPESEPRPTDTEESFREFPNGPLIRRARMKLIEYDAEQYQRYCNTASTSMCSIDGYFYNHQEQALRVLQGLIDIADRGMALITAEILRMSEARVDINLMLPAPPLLHPPSTP